MQILKKIFGDPNQKEIKKVMRRVEEVNALEDGIKSLTDEELKQKTVVFKERLEQGETLDDLLPEAFAVVREVSWRTLGMRHFDVQILGGIVLHQGRIAEMKTGEGKTLVATLPAYLNALTGKGVHIITVNDYLARRDSEWMGEIYKFLGLKVGLIVHGISPEERREAYGADIAYGTNNEFGFDYLRDNMVTQKERLVQRSLNYTIVDEVDSILIDEARTPLIISGHAGKSSEDYKRINSVVTQLIKPGKILDKTNKDDKDGEDENIDQYYVEIDEKAKVANLTAKGQERAEKLLGRKIYGTETMEDDTEDSEDGEGDGSSIEDMELQGLIRQGLKAHILMKSDQEYVVKNGEVIIVDEFTGRLMHGRRYSDGLHQAIEAKEGVKVARESQTLASITFQNYFRMYNKLAGMTGTAITEEDEFIEIYKRDVVVIPTNMPMIRQDLQDIIYKNEEAKFRSVVNEIVERHRKGQPQLVGTISIERSELLSKLLSKQGVKHNVLNAKHHEKEADIVAQTGEKGAVTIATNMAGRGTDIVLGGNIESKIEAIKNNEDLSEREIEQKIKDLKESWKKENKEVLDLGGLHIIGTERHESRRIDNQLRGRSGRQGDPGSTQFFISLEDDLMRLFGGENISNIMDKLGVDEDQPIDHPMISKAIENAQKKVEARNFDIRKNVLEYDNVINEQREVIYRQRRRVLEGEDLKDTVRDMIEESITSLVGLYCDEKIYPEDWDLKGLIDTAESILLPPGAITVKDITEKEGEEIKEMLLEKAVIRYEEREKELGEETLRELERVILLRTVDSKWMNHIDVMSDLRQGINLRAYGQRNPVLEYKKEAYDIFQSMIDSIREDVVKLIYRVQVVSQPESRSVVSEASASLASQEGIAQLGGGEAQKPQQPRRVEKVGRNEPCPCGSGKKHKKCCGRS